MSGETSATTSKETRDAEAAAQRHAHNSASAFDAPSRDTNSTPMNAGPQAEPADLLNFIPENFQEIPYIAQINVKRKSMESFNAELTKL